MLTYSFQARGKDSLYEYLYKQIKADILSGSLSQGEKLPSKRALAEHLDISTITVENAYNQLVAEGYIYPKAKSGFYVSSIVPTGPTVCERPVYKKAEEQPRQDFIADFSGGSTAKDTFPFATWTKLMREVMSEKKALLTHSSPSVGIYELRQALSDYLLQFRGLRADPDCIIVGAGTEYLYALIIQLLGRDKIYATEDPGYRKIEKIYKANNVSTCCIPLDDKGVSPEDLRKEKADVLHISPSHHFPTGTVTPVSRRYELLSWANESPQRYIIEDDYDSEFRFAGKPIPTLKSIDTNERVIYINTFSKSLTSTIRISYMVLPEGLMEKYRNHLSFYSCTVSNFEQYTLAAFIERGFFEKHINRMRNFYKSKRNALMTEIKKHPDYGRVQILEEDSGLHFLMKFETDLTDKQLVEKGRDLGISLSCLSEYYSYDIGRSKTLIINYSSLTQGDIKKAVELLFKTIEKP